MSSSVLHHSSTMILTWLPCRASADAQSAKSVDLRLPGLGDDKAFDQQLVAAHRRFELAEIDGDRVDVAAEQFAERAVDIEMDPRPVIGVPDLADALDDPVRIGDQLLALEPDVALDLLKRGVRQQLDPLQDHAVDHLHVLLVAGRQDRDRCRGDCAAVFAADDLRHRATVGQRGGVQQGLGDAVAQRGMQPLSVMDEPVDFFGEIAEAVDRPAAQQLAHRRAQKLRDAARP